jgi:hypothetical protein
VNLNVQGSGVFHHHPERMILNHTLTTRAVRRAAGNAESTQ